LCNLSGLPIDFADEGGGLSIERSNCRFCAEALDNLAELKFPTSSRKNAVHLGVPTFQTPEVSGRTLMVLSGRAKILLQPNGDLAGDSRVLSV
jgi:hypothetical protein